MFVKGKVIGDIPEKTKVNYNGKADVIINSKVLKGFFVYRGGKLEPMYSHSYSGDEVHDIDVEKVGDYAFLRYNGKYYFFGFELSPREVDAYKAIIRIGDFEMNYYNDWYFSTEDFTAYIFGIPFNYYGEKIFANGKYYEPIDLVRYGPFILFDLKPEKWWRSGKKYYGKVGTETFEIIHGDLIFYDDIRIVAERDGYRYAYIRADAGSGKYYKTWKEALKAALYRKIKTQNGKIVEIKYKKFPFDYSSYHHVWWSYYMRNKYIETDYLPRDISHSAFKIGNVVVDYEDPQNWKTMIRNIVYERRCGQVSITKWLDDAHAVAVSKEALHLLDKEVDFPKVDFNYRFAIYYPEFDVYQYLYAKDDCFGSSLVFYHDGQWFINYGKFEEGTFVVSAKDYKDFCAESIGEFKGEIFGVIDVKDEYEVL